LRDAENDGDGNVRDYGISPMQATRSGAGL
jgi:hypothetical protein